MPKKVAKMQKATILIADDDKAILKILEFNLMKQGYKTVTSLTLSGAREIIQSGEVDVALLDVMFPEGLSTEILPDIVKSDNTFQVIMTTASKSVENAITAMKRGAYDYILKPFDFDRLFATIEHALDGVRAAKEIAQLKNNLLSKYQFENIIGDSEPMKELFHLMKQVLDVNATVLLQADSGTGKELVAKAIHYSSARKDNPFVDVNCAAITETLLESELFGHEKGSFTGATERHIGKFEQADGGTLFLDEISEMPLNTQARILRVIQEKEFHRVGGKDKVKVNVRIIVATNRDLSEMVKQKTFREDLFYRISVFPMGIPLLRKRRKDIPLLIAHFLRKYEDEIGKQIKTVALDAMQLLTQYSWPGNVRELENVIQRAMIVCEGDTISRNNLPVEITAKSKSTMVLGENAVLIRDPESKEIRKFKDIEKEVLEQTLKASGENMSRAAKSLGIGRATLYRKAKKYNLDID